MLALTEQEKLTILTAVYNTRVAREKAHRAVRALGMLETGVDCSGDTAEVYQEAVDSLALGVREATRALAIYSAHLEAVQMAMGVRPLEGLPEVVDASTAN